ncbi:unnamed protein product [Microthlaspi erraticum]|uniref:ATP-grasp domain-containing protein n=1 Tax=Microthlaspi erraticum TaxID=1685480 RepID=A0A6D2I7A6_9BRAS|nr:unnamed protein product [Microthlaspi erraticum]
MSVLEFYSSAVISFCEKWNVGLVVIDPEVRLVAGLASDLVEARIPTCGPSSQAAAKFLKNLCQKFSIPTAKDKTFSDASAAKAYIQEQGVPIVVKAEASRGENAIGDGDTIVRGDPECQVLLASCSGGENAIHPESAQVYKRVGDGDTSPNTAGMGA